MFLILNHQLLFAKTIAEAVLDQEQAIALGQLLALDDNDLLDLLLGRSNAVAALDGEVSSPVLQKLLLMLREK